LRLNFSTVRPIEPPAALPDTVPPCRELIELLLQRLYVLEDRAKVIVANYTPKHGSWLNMAEIEINVMVRQCLNWRIADIETLRSQVTAWQASRDQIKAKINWQFTTDTARTKIKQLLSDIG